MFKKFAILSALLVSLLLLAACGPGTIDPDLTTEATESMAYPEPSEVEGSTSLTATPTMPVVNETMEATEEVTIEATQTLETTKVIPSTGDVNSGQVTTLIGLSVRDQSAEEIGTVEDLVLNMGDKQVDYVLVTMGDKVIAVPWEALQAPGTVGSSSSDGFTFPGDPGEFTDAPVLDVAKIPTVGDDDMSWDSEISGYWQGLLSETPMAETPESTVESTPNVMEENGMKGVILASKLIGYGLNFQAGLNQVKTSVDDIIVDVDSGEVQYLVVSVSIAGSEATLIPIPLDVIRWDDVNKVFTLSAPVQDIANAPTFTGDVFPDTSTPGWDDEIRSYWENLTSSK
jgi:sporulation protein YlmC with PRC-barrel domain